MSDAPSDLVMVYDVSRDERLPVTQQWCDVAQQNASWQARRNSIIRGIASFKLIYDDKERVQDVLSKLEAVLNEAGIRG